MNVAKTTHPCVEAICRSSGPESTPPAAATAAAASAPAAQEVRQFNMNWRCFSRTNDANCAGTRTKRPPMLQREFRIEPHCDAAPVR